MDDKSNSDFHVEDGEDFKGSDALGIKEICLEQFRRCCVEGSKEMLRGGTEIRTVRGMHVEVTVPNQREIFINSVKMLEIIMKPDILKNEKIMNKIKEINRKIKEHNKKFQDEYKSMKENYKSRLKKAADHTKWQNTKKLWDDFIENIKDRSELDGINLSRRKMTELSKLLYNLNYYNEESFSMG